MCVARGNQNACVLVNHYNDLAAYVCTFGLNLIKQFIWEEGRRGDCSGGPRER